MKAERRRPLILDAALPLFVEHGYRNTSMDAVAAAAGVAKPVLYDCFPDKRALLRALVEREERRLLRQMAEAFPTDVDLDDLEDVLGGALAASFAAVASSPDSWRAVFDARHAADPEIAPRIERARSRQQERIRGLVMALLADRGVDNPERQATVVAQVIAAAGDACAQLILADPDTWDPEDLARMVARLLARGVRGL